MNLHELIAPAAAILTAIVTGWLARQAAVRVAREGITERRLEVDAAAYERARLLYEAGIAQLEAQIDRLQRQINEERASSQMMREEVSLMRETIATLRRQLIDAGIDVARAHGPTTGKQATT